MRPFRARPEVRWRGVLLPLPALIGAPITFAVWILAMITHPGADTPARPGSWAASSSISSCAAASGTAFSTTSTRSRALPPGAEFKRVLVPMKLGDIGEEMVATAVALAKERNATVEAIFVVRVPREFPLEGPLPQKVAERAHMSLEEARALGEDNDVVVETETIRARSIGHAIVEEAARRDADLIVLGSSPRWRRQSRFFSPTVDHVLRHAPCQVLVVAFPEGVFEDGGGPGMTPLHVVYAPSMKCIVIGCGRVGSAVALQLAAEGWDVTCVDEKEEALNRLGNWRGGFIVGHGMDSDVLRDAGAAEADAAVVSTDGDNTNIVIGQVLQKRYGIELHRRAGARPAARGLLRAARPAHRVPDADGDLRADRGGARVRRAPARAERRGLEKRRARCTRSSRVGAR